MSAHSPHYSASKGAVVAFTKSLAAKVAPGSMGNIEFVIPTEILSDSLVSNEYIQ